MHNEGIHFPKTPLAVDPTTREFCVGQEQELRLAVESFDLHTDIMPIDRLREVELNPDGTVGDRQLRLTTWSLYQICRWVCPGLYQAVIELMSDGREETKLAAVSIINLVIRLNFADKLHGHRLVVDRQNGTVEAVVGRTYRFISNSVVYECLRERLDRLDTKVAMSEASLRGRWMLLRFYSVNPLLTTDWDGLKYHAGWHLSNHEGGQAPVRVGNLLLRGKGRLGMLMPKGHGSVVRHAGPARRSKLSSLIDRVISYSPWRADVVAADLKRSQATRLGLGLPTKEAEAVRHGDLVKKIVLGSKVYTTTAARVVAATVVQAYNDPKPRSLLSLSRDDIASRTLCDLAASASREGRLRDIATREGLDQLAYRLLVGSIKV